MWVVNFQDPLTIFMALLPYKVAGPDPARPQASLLLLRVSQLRTCRTQSQRQSSLATGLGQHD